MPLNTALPILKKQFEIYLESAALEAFMTTIEVPDDVPSPIGSRIKRDGEKAARKFAKKFKDQCANQLAQAIHDYVMQIGIMATAGGSLMGTSITYPSPVVGTLNPNDFKVF